MAILMAFKTNDQYHFSPQITGLKSDNARSVKSTPHHSSIICSNNGGLLDILFPFSFYSSPCTSYWLQTICITFNYNKRIFIPSYNFNIAITFEIKRSLSFFSFFWHQLEYTSLSYQFSLCQLPWIPWLLGHISINSLKRSRIRRCDHWEFYKFSKYFWQYVYPEVHHYLDLSYLDKFWFFKGVREIG